jgi:hypothetical protein
MRFSWAFALAQKVHEHIAKSILPDIPILSDHRLIPSFNICGLVRITYADNGVIIGHNRVDVDAARTKSNLHMKSIGVSVREIQPAKRHSILLGWMLDV